MSTMHVPLLLVLALTATACVGRAIAAYDFAVDVYGAASRNNFNCLQRNGYAVAFIRCYEPSGNGQPDANARANIVNAYDANLGVEVYVQPNPSGSKGGATQCQEAYDNLKRNGISVDTIWILVTQPSAWPSNTNANVNFIRSFLQQALRNNLKVGVYTNWYDWYLITNNYSGALVNANVMLWYWHTLGSGTNAETAADFQDFRAFGGWSEPIVKQFAIREQVCGVTLGREVFERKSRRRVVANYRSAPAIAAASFATAAQATLIRVGNNFGTAADTNTNGKSN